MSRAEAEFRVTATEQTVEWTIEHYDQEMARNDGRMSRTFYFAETEHCLKFCRIFSQHTNRRMLFLNLHKGIEFTGRVNCELGLKTYEGSVCVIGAATLSDEDTLTGVVYSVELPGISSGGSVTFFCTLSTADDQNTQTGCRTSSPGGNTEGGAAEGTASSESVHTLAQNFKQLFISGLHSDVIMGAKDREFQAHRCVLSARSPVFASMFQHEIIEESRGLVDIADCDAHVFEALLLFLYTADVVHLTLENAVGLYTIAEKYQVKELKRACAQFLKSRLKIGTICDADHLAVVHDETELLEAATGFS